MNCTASENEIKKYTTFKIGANAKKIYVPTELVDFVELLKKLKSPLILGAGSNILASSTEIDREVIVTTGLNKFDFVNNEVTVQCGVKAQRLSKEAMDRSLSGFEFMIGIPATVGGLLVMNAGAHNQTTSECFVSADVFDMKSKKIITLTKEQMNFSYRHSILSEKNYVLLSAKFELIQQDYEKIQNIVERNLEFRKKHQPSLAQPNAGSVFKNPPNDSAGRLLDLAGVKSLTCGGACVYEKHANFIINQNNATSEDVSQLMLNMRNLVKNKYNICLKPEVKFVGIKTKKEQQIWQELLSN